MEPVGEMGVDAEVAMATAQGLFSRQSSIASYSDNHTSRDSPSETFSEEGSESERSSPADIS